MSEISQERKAELRAQCEPSITGTHKPVAYWELRTLLDYADERDDLRICENCDRETGTEVYETMVCVRCWNRMASQRDEAVALIHALWTKVNWSIVPQHEQDRIDALLRRVGGSHE